MKRSISSGLAQWNKVLDADIFKPIVDEVAQKTEVMLVGYAGGGKRNIFANKPVCNLGERKGSRCMSRGRRSGAGLSPHSAYRRR